MSKVFSELGFVKIENGFASVMETAGKRDLTEAPAYKERERQIELEEKLLYAPYMELKQWFDTMRNGTVDREEQLMDLKEYVTIVPDYPKKGISFKDISTIMDNGKAYKFATDEIVKFAKEVETDIIVGPEARGFIIGCPVAYALEVGFAPVRKPGNCHVKRLRSNMILNMEKILNDS